MKRKLRKITSSPLHFLKKCVGLGLILALIAILFVPPLLRPQVAEAGLTNVSATLSRLAINATANHTINFTVNTAVTTGQTIKVQWDPVGDAFDLGTLAFADITFTGATLVTTCSAVHGDEVTVAIDATAPNENVTFTVCTGDTVATGTKSIVFGNERITNPITDGFYTISIGGTMADSGEALVTILPDDTVVVTADVVETLSFSISDNTIFFGTLSITASTFATGEPGGSPTEIAAHTITAATNAANGYVITVDGTTLGISGTPHTIEPIGATATEPSPGTEQFGINLVHSGGAGTATMPYNDQVPPFTFAFDTAAFPDQIASSPTLSFETIYSVYYVANISPATEAGVYSASLIYTATATF